jgi:DNA-binding CsgD family transcriptional regulator
MPSDALLQLIGDTHSLLDLDEFRVELLTALGRAVPADWVSLNDISRNPNDTVVLSDPDPPLDLLDAFARYAHQNPLVAYHARTLDGRPCRFSDLVSQRELHALDLYTSVYAKLGVEYQIAFTLPTERGRVLGIALSRSDHDFSDTERDLLADARPFLIQSYRNAIRFTDVLRNPAAIDSPRRELLMGLGLTGRQSDVLLLVATGASERTIAERLGISHRTVQKHLERCYRQLGVSSRSQAAAIAWAAAEPRADGAPDTYSGSEKPASSAASPGSSSAA